MSVSTSTEELKLLIERAIQMFTCGSVEDHAQMTSKFDLFEAFIISKR